MATGDDSPGKAEGDVAILLNVSKLYVSRGGSRALARVLSSVAQLNYGFAQIKGGVLRPWQYHYVLAGYLTFLFGLWCFYLNPEERIVAVERLRRGQTGIRNQEIKKEQIVEGLLDVTVWLIFVTMASAYTVNGAVTGLGPLIVFTYGHTAL